MPEETLRMSRKERDRLVVMQQVEAGGLKLVEAARRMGVSYRQTKRIWRRFGRDGASGLVHQSRDRLGNRRHDAAFKQRVVGLYRERYADFGPTLAAEKMAEREGVEVNRETLRRWLIGACLWPGRSAWRRHRRRRPRRAHFGELVQFDGSHHAWFEDRGEGACLMVMVDDATGHSEALMAEGETTEAAFLMLRKWIECYGVPAALYTDCKNIYVADREPTREERLQGTGALTDFSRACWRLGIEIIPAHSPQAKGRVERRNGLYQDRFVKELRLGGIDTVAGANALVDPFSAALNRRFAIAPADGANRHRALPLGEPLEDILCYERTRVVQNDWTFTLDGRVFQIPAQPGAPRARRRVTLRRRLDGTLLCLYQGAAVTIQEIGKSTGAGRRLLTGMLPGPHGGRGLPPPPPPTPRGHFYCAGEGDISNVR